MFLQIPVRVLIALPPPLRVSISFPSKYITSFFGVEFQRSERAPTFCNVYRCMNSCMKSFLTGRLLFHFARRQPCSLVVRQPIRCFQTAFRLGQPHAQAQQKFGLKIREKVLSKFLKSSAMTDPAIEEVIAPLQKSVKEQVGP